MQDFRPSSINACKVINSPIAKMATALSDGIQRPLADGSPGTALSTR
jgi:hypothetical protein